MTPDEKYPAYRSREQGTEYGILTVGIWLMGLSISEQFSWLQIRLILEELLLECNIGGVSALVKP